MTRKDYAKIANVLCNCHPSGTSSITNCFENSLAVPAGRLIQWHIMVRAIANTLATDNPRFDRTKFYRACGLDAE